MSIYINVSAGGRVWGREIAPEQYDALKQNIELATSRKVSSLRSSCLMPTRTNNLTNLATDLFFPTLAGRLSSGRISHAEYIASSSLDLITLPFRLMTCIPRILYNASQETDPLYNSLQEEACDKEILDADFMIVDLVKIEQTSNRFKTIRTRNEVYARVTPFGGNIKTPQGIKEGSEIVYTEVLADKLMSMPLLNPEETAMVTFFKKQLPQLRLK